MMEECRLSMLQRKRLQGFINNGQSLPVISKHEQKQVTNRPSKSLFDVKQMTIGRKRTKLEITNMGAYEKEKVIPKPGGDFFVSLSFVIEEQFVDNNRKINWRSTKFQ
jgi:hypothetical protein